MSAMPSPRFYEILLPAKQSAERPAFRMAGQNGDWFADDPPRHRQRASRLVVHLLVMFVLGAVATLAWLSYSHAAREIVAGLSPQLRWLAPPAEAVKPAPDRLQEITRSVDRISGDIAASREQIARSIDHLAAGQEQMSREIIRLQALSQYAAARKEEPPSRRGPIRRASHHWQAR